MGRATVRAQIASYFAPANVAGLSQIYRSRPNRIDPRVYNLSAGGGSGAVMVIHIPSADETRLTLGPPTAAQKFDKHDISIEVLFQSVKVDAQAANDDLDALIDAFKVRFRADRTLGSTNGVPIWQAGEMPEGIKVEFGPPRLGKQNFIQNGLIRFQAWEDVTG